MPPPIPPDFSRRRDLVQRCVGADIARTSEIDAMFEVTEAKLKSRGLKSIDILVNNVGMPGGGASGDPGSVGTVSEELIDALFATIVRGTVMVTQRALPRKKRADDGASRRLINERPGGHCQVTS